MENLNNNIKNSNKKIIMPIILIPLIILLLIIGYMTYFYIQYNSSFINLSNKKVKKYLDKNYNNQYENVKFLYNTKSDHSSDYDCGTMYDSDFYNVYSVYSKKYDTTFEVCYNKKLFGIDICAGCKTQKPAENITDNLEMAIKNKKLIEEFKDELSKVAYAKVETVNNVNEDKIITINDNFNVSYHNALIKLKKSYRAFREESDDKGFIYSKYDYIIKFNNIEFKATHTFTKRNGEYESGYGIEINDESLNDVVEIENDDFWEYVGR